MAGSRHREHRSTRGALRLLIERGHVDEAAATASSARAWAAAEALAARLAEADRRITHLTEANPAAVLTIDDTGVVAAWNDAAGRLFGLDHGAPAARLEDLVGARPDTMARPSASDSLEAWRHAEGKDICVRVRRPDDSWFGARLSSSAWQDDGRTWLTVVIRDVEGTDRSDAAARPDAGSSPVDAGASGAATAGPEPSPTTGEADRAFRELVEQMPGVVYRTRDRLHGKVDYVSPRIETLLGYTPEAWCGTPRPVGRLRAPRRPRDRPGRG